MSSFAERIEMAKKMFEIADTYLTDEEKLILDGVNRLYEERKNINDPNWSGMHFRSLNEAIKGVEGGEDAWKKWNWIIEGLVLSGKFD